MTPDRLSSVLMLLTALVLPIAALLKRQSRPDFDTGRLILVWLTIIAIAWLLAILAQDYGVNFT